MSKKIWRFRHIFVDFSEYMNFNKKIITFFRLQRPLRKFCQAASRTFHPTCIWQGTFTAAPTTQNLVNMSNVFTIPRKHWFYTTTFLSAVWGAYAPRTPWTQRSVTFSIIAATVFPHWKNPVKKTSKMPVLWTLQFGSLMNRLSKRLLRRWVP